MQYSLQTKRFIMFTVLGLGVMVMTLVFQETEHIKELLPVEFISYTSQEVAMQDVFRFNGYLNTKRKHYLMSTARNMKNFSKYSGSNKFVVSRELNRDYFVMMQNHTDIRTYALFINKEFDLHGANVEWMDKTPRRDHVSMPDSPIYPIGLEHGACKLLYQRGYQKKHMRLISGNSGICAMREFYNTRLEPLQNQADNVFAIEFKHASAFWERFFMHIVPYARISNLGVVLHDNLYINPLDCNDNNKFSDLEKIHSEKWFNQSVVVDEVFVSKHKWGSGYFHWNAESISRLALYIEFLNANPNIQIFIPEKALTMAQNTLNLLGMSNVPNRLVWGNILGKTVYVSQGPRCGLRVSTYGLTIATDYYRKSIASNLNKTSQMDTIILIHRTKKRYLQQHTEIKDMLEKLAATNNLRFQVFSDNKLPSFNETVRIYNRAAMVVAPHGAGLVNTMFSQPGTVVIEVLCAHKASVLCYPFFIRSIGHIYYGIRHDKYKKQKSCSKIWVDVDILKNVTEFYLKYISNRK